MEAGEVKVICVGLSRTGTSSLKAALSVLLPGLTYHGMDFLNEINNKVRIQRHRYIAFREEF